MTFARILDALAAALDWLPEWAVAVLILMLAAGVAALFHDAALRLLRRAVPGRHVFAHSLIDSTRRLIRLGLVVAALSIVLPLVPLDREARGLIGHGLLVAVIALVG